MDNDLKKITTKPNDIYRFLSDYICQFAPDWTCKIEPASEEEFAKLKKESGVE